MPRTMLRSLWNEPRPADPPPRGWRDRVLLAVLLTWSVLEVVLRQDLASRPVVLATVLVILAPLLGGTFEAGPAGGRGGLVSATLPCAGAAV